MEKSDDGGLMAALTEIVAPFEAIWFIGTIIAYLKEENRKEMIENPIYFIVGFTALALCVSFYIVKGLDAKDTIIGKIILLINGLVAPIAIGLIVGYMIIGIVFGIVLAIMFGGVFSFCFGGNEETYVCFPKKN